MAWPHPANVTKRCGPRSWPIAGHPHIEKDLAAQMPAALLKAGLAAPLGGSEDGRLSTALKRDFVGGDVLVGRLSAQWFFWRGAYVQDAGPECRVRSIEAVIRLIENPRQPRTRGKTGTGVSRRKRRR